MNKIKKALVLALLGTLNFSITAMEMEEANNLSEEVLINNRMKDWVGDLLKNFPEHMMDLSKQPSVVFIDNKASNLSDIGLDDEMYPILKISGSVLGLSDITKDIKSLDYYNKANSIFLEAKDDFFVDENFYLEKKNLIINAPVLTVAKGDKVDSNHAIKVNKTLYLIGKGFDKKTPEFFTNDKVLRLESGKSILKDFCYPSKLELYSNQIIFKGSSFIKFLQTVSDVEISNDSQIFSKEISCTGSLKNYGLIRAGIFKVFGQFLINGLDNDRMAIIKADDMQVDLTKNFDNRFGKIWAEKNINIKSLNVICGDKITKTANESERLKGSMLGWSCSYTDVVGTKYAYGNYFISNGSFIKSLGKLEIDSQILQVNHGEIFSDDFMFLKARNNININAGFVKALKNLDIETQELSLTREPVSNLHVGWMSKCYHNDYSQSRTSKESIFMSENIRMHLQKAVLEGSLILYKNSIFINGLELDQINKEKFFAIKNYQGEYLGTNGFRHALRFFFQDESKVEKVINPVMEDTIQNNLLISLIEDRILDTKIIKL